MIERRFLTVKETAELLGTRVSTVYSWVHTKQIPYYKIGHLVKFKQDDINNWVEDRKVLPSGAKESGRGGL